MAKSTMTAEEYLEQYTKFKAMAADATEESDKTRFEKVASGMYTKYEQAVASDLVDRKIRFEKRILKKTGNFDEWMTWAQSLYKIEPHEDGVTLRSLARDWNKTWQYPHEIDALEHVEKLIGYKIYDRSRERGSIEADLSEIKE